jgi:ribosomal protein L30/L7E
MRRIRSVIGALRKHQKCESVQLLVLRGGHQCRLRRRNAWSRGDLVEEIAHVDGLAQKSISFSVHKRSTKE